MMKKQISTKLDGQIGFAVHPRRWVVGRFFAWLGRNRRLAKDFEGTVASQPPSSMPLPPCSLHGGWRVRLEIRVGLLAGLWPFSTLDAVGSRTGQAPQHKEGMVQASRHHIGLR